MEQGMRMLAVLPETNGKPSPGEMECSSRHGRREVGRSRKTGSSGLQPGCQESEKWPGRLRIGLGALLVPETVAGKQTVQEAAWLWMPEVLLLTKLLLENPRKEMCLSCCWTGGTFAFYLLTSWMQEDLHPVPEDLTPGASGE